MHKIYIITSGILSQFDSNQERTLLWFLYIKDSFKSFTAFTYPSIGQSLLVDEGVQAHFLNKLSKSSALLKPLTLVFTHLVHALS